MGPKHHQRLGTLLGQERYYFSLPVTNPTKPKPPTTPTCFAIWGFKHLTTQKPRVIVTYPQAILESILICLKNTLEVKGSQLWFVNEFCLIPIWTVDFLSHNRRVFGAEESSTCFRSPINTLTALVRWRSRKSPVSCDKPPSLPR